MADLISNQIREQKYKTTDLHKEIQMTINILSYFPSLIKAAFSLPKDFLLHFFKARKESYLPINKTIQK